MLLEVKDLNIEFYDTQPPQKVVKGISFSMEPGEILGIVGESGSGKTQTALSILQLLKSNSGISSGEILFKGKNLAGLSARQLQTIRGKEISMIFQEPMTSLNPVLTIGRQVEEALKIHGETDREKRRSLALEALSEAGLGDPEGIYGKYPHQLSGGQKQRLCIARALLKRPKVLILDDSTSAVDTATEGKIRKRMEESLPGVTKIIIAQRISSVRHADQIIILDDGKIHDAGTHEELLLRNEIYQQIYESQKEGAEL